ncbi:MAG: hypothetical protein H0X25_18470 [Acidobacteriales bacterium]|nr:hypothetical protein [Terriglobales bacterium]
MNAVEFTKELSGAAVLPIPIELLPSCQRRAERASSFSPARDSDDADWRNGAYEQFLRDDPEEDAIYDSCR